MKPANCSCLEVHAAIGDYMYIGRKAAKFTAEEHSSVYDTHIAVLTKLEQEHGRAYHRLMGKLFIKIT